MDWNKYSNGNNELPEGFEHSSYYNEHGAGWNTATSDPDVFESWLSPEIAARNAATRERNAWLEQAEYNSEQAKMARMKEAGINLNTAAAGIAGSGNAPSASPVAQSQPSDFGQDLSSLVGTAFGVPGQLSEAAKLGAETQSINEKLPFEKNLLRASTYESFMNAKFSNEQAIGLSIENFVRGETAIADIGAKFLNLDLMQAEIDLKKKMFDSESKKIDLLESEISLNKEAKSLMELQEQTEQLNQMRLRIENERLQWHLDFLKRNNIDLTLPSNSYFASVIFGNGTLLQKKLAISNLLNAQFSSQFVDSRGMSLGSYSANKGLIGYQSYVDDILNRNKHIYENKFKRYEVGIGDFHVR